MALSVMCPDGWHDSEPTINPVPGTFVRTRLRQPAIRLALAATLALLGSLSLVRAQERPWVSPHPLKLSFERALAISDTVERELPYIPGEVLVKFKSGTGAAGQQRAL